MEIQGLDYNTGRERLQLPEYGREIQKMVDVAVSLPSRDERLQCARTIVRLMETKVPEIRDNADYEQTLWDHLYLMSGKQLDIDWPYDVSQAEKILTPPQQIPLPQAQIGLRHYGRLVLALCQELKQMPAGARRDQLARQTAHQMKRDLLTWGHGSVENEKVADDLARLTDGVIQLDLSHFMFDRVAAITQDEGGKKGKKKK
jgi:hypothetical protein